MFIVANIHILYSHLIHYCNDSRIASYTHIAHGANDSVIPQLVESGLIDNPLTDSYPFEGYDPIVLHSGRGNSEV